MNFDDKIVRLAHDFAVHAHRSTNHLYDGQPYETHLEAVVSHVEKYKALIEGEEENVIAAAWLHDVIEDCRVTYNDVAQKFGHTIAELVFAVTIEKGRTRKDRENLKYFEGIRAVQDATFLKLCDRLANIRYSSENKSSMLSTYRKESEYFSYQLNEKRLQPMFDEMSLLLRPFIISPV